MKEILKVEAERRKKGELPQDCPAPQMQRKTFKQLGEPTAQMEQLCSQRSEVSRWCRDFFR